MKWNTVPDEMEQHSRRHGTGVHHSWNKVGVVKAVCQGLSISLPEMKQQLIKTDEYVSGVTLTTA